MISMKIFGIDFTSAPSSKKPITCAVGWLDGSSLQVECVEALTDYAQFEALLASQGPWVAGLDFPFAQSQRFIDNLGWPRQWSQYMKNVSQLSRAEFVTLLEDYKVDRPKGDKEHRRAIDVLASAISPQKLFGVPVAKMFYEGARRLYQSHTDIVPLRRLDTDKIVVEAYPAIVARRFIARRSYKNDQKSKQTVELRLAREDLVDGILSDGLKMSYGLLPVLSSSLQQQLLDDASGDSLDAVLCAVQAAWAYGQRQNNYGIPQGVNSCEGWIADPQFMQ
jgi:hypothetical protein